MINELRAAPGYWYVATPYSKYPGGIEAAFEAACKWTAWLIRQGVSAYSPIAHTHPVAMAGGMDPLDHAIWLPADKALMDAAHGLLIVELAGWDFSTGILQEQCIFNRAAKPVRYLGTAVAFHGKVAMQPWTLKSLRNG